MLLNALYNLWLVSVVFRCRSSCPSAVFLTDYGCRISVFSLTYSDPNNAQYASMHRYPCFPQ